MTNKETKQAIAGITEFFKGITGNQDMKIPNDLAKKYGLEQEPCEDAISRDAVLEKAVYTETEEGWSGYTVDVDYIKSLPSVKPQLICEEREKGECPYYAG